MWIHIGLTGRGGGPTKTKTSDNPCGPVLFWGASRASGLNDHHSCKHRAPWGKEAVWWLPQLLADDVSLERPGLVGLLSTCRVMAESCWAVGLGRGR